MRSSMFSMKRGSLMAAAVAVVVASLCASSAMAEVKRSISVAPIGWTGGTVSWITGEALHAQMITELNKSGKYVVVERENLDGILKEQDLGASGRMRTGSAPKVGELEGAQIQVKCVITDAEEESGKGGRIGFRGVGIGGAKTIYRVTMDVRIYDNETGKILATETVTAEQEKGSKSGGLSVGGLSLGGDKSGGDTTGAITRDLIKEAIAKIDIQAKKTAWRGKVISISGEKIIVVGGERDGLEAGMKFKIAKLGEPLKDPDTGEILDAGEETVIGTIELTSVKEKIGYAKLLDGKVPSKGDVTILIVDKKK
jgi:curli biogenesis system outer membrane secretion channel CsgG